MRKLIQNRPIRWNQSWGYTLIEVVMVTVIIGILAAITAPSLDNWKNLQLLQAKQQALQTKLEAMKADAARWGAQCTLDGATLTSTCTSNLIKRKTSEVMSKITSAPESMNPTANLANEANIFIATNFEKITISPRGFMHINTGSTATSNALFVIGYKSKSAQFDRNGPELCIVVEHLTGRVSSGMRTTTTAKLQVNQAIQKLSGLNHSQCQV